MNMKDFESLLAAQVERLSANPEFTLEDWRDIIFSEDDLAEQLFEEDSEEFIAARDMQYDAVFNHAPERAPA